MKNIMLEITFKKQLLFFFTRREKQIISIKIADRDELCRWCAVLMDLNGAIESIDEIKL